MPIPATNADRLPAIEFTEDQKFIFDTRGWIALPGVLTDDEAAEMREFCYRLQSAPESIPEHHRSPIGGPLEKLTDHPHSLGVYERVWSQRVIRARSATAFAWRARS